MIMYFSLEHFFPASLSSFPFFPPSLFPSFPNVSFSHLLLHFLSTLQLIHHYKVWQFNPLYPAEPYWRTCRPWTFHSQILQKVFLQRISMKVRTVDWLAFHDIYLFYFSLFCFILLYFILRCSILFCFILFYFFFLLYFILLYLALSYLACFFILFSLNLACFFFIVSYLFSLFLFY